MYVPYLYMPKTKLKTLTTFLMNYAGAQQGSWPTLAAAIIVVLIPTVVLYLIFHKQITEGLSRRNKGITEVLTMSEFMSYDPWAEITTRNGYAGDEMVAMLQKAIRRGQGRGRAARGL